MLNGPKKKDDEMINYDIYNADDSLLFAAQIDCAESAPAFFKKRLAVLWAINNKLNLSGAVLPYTNLSDTNLSGVDFSDALLWGVSFFRTNLTKATFYRADLSGVNFADTNLLDTDFTDARIKGVKGVPCLDFELVGGRCKIGTVAILGNKTYVQLGVRANLLPMVLEKIRAGRGKNSEYERKILEAVSKIEATPARKEHERCV